uniref:MPN domain-containing protein n=2 Tax=Rhodosorus marinus TaxID=101924 RepID=A0A7S2ZQY0_9RHOD|mmetsp:Transcript_27070/g.105356  ORF Transcript_27070/g.105356 Transcript_27070/m.105356 type:complete len:318 (+) Transcript_27070:155-1108(+)
MSWRPSSVAVHPIVLLGVVDHFNRVSKHTNKRAVGILLGQTSRGVVSCTNSFAVPFEEDAKDTSVWFLDHNFLENMMEMTRKVNAREQIVGWYSTGPKIRPSDLDINELLRNYCANPVLVVVDPDPKELGLPTEAYFSVEEPKEATVQRTFVHVPAVIDASEAEEVGVGHLLRDVKESSISTLTSEVTSKLSALKSLMMRLQELKEYLMKVADGELEVNNEIMYNMQDIFNLLPSFNTKVLVESFASKTNDAMLVLYLSSLIRSIIALHNLVDNKLLMRDSEREVVEEAGVVEPKDTKEGKDIEMKDESKENEPENK